MNHYIPECDCPEGKSAKALVTQTLPEGWQQMPPETVFLYSWAECSHCGKVLKHACTMPYTPQLRHRPK